MSQKRRVRGSSRLYDTHDRPPNHVTSSSTELIGLDGTSWGATTSDESIGTERRRCDAASGRRRAGDDDVELAAVQVGEQLRITAEDGGHRHVEPDEAREDLGGEVLGAGAEADGWLGCWHRAGIQVAQHTFETVEGLGDARIELPSSAGGLHAGGLADEQ